MSEKIHQIQMSNDFEVDDFEEEFIEDDDEYDEHFNSYDPVKKTPAYHVQQAERALEQLKFVVKESGWKKAHTVRGGATVYSKNGIEDNDKVPVFMCEHIIEGFAPQPIFAVIGMRKLWDPWYEEGNLVENLNDTTSLTYMVMSGVAGVRTRDLSLVEKIESLSDGTIYFASTSIITDKVPRVTDKVRANLHLNGWILKPLSDNPPRTSITYVLQSKVNGWVPSIVARKYLLKRPLVVYTIDRYLQKNGPPPIVISSTPSESSYPSGSVSGSSSIHLPNGTGISNNADLTNRGKRNLTLERKQNKSIIIQHSPKNGRISMQNTTFHSSEEDKETNSSLSSPPLTSPPLSPPPSSPPPPSPPSLPKQQAVLKQGRMSNQHSVQESTSVKTRSINPIVLAPVQPTISTQPDSVPARPSIVSLTFTPPPPPQHKPQLLKKTHRHTDTLNRAVTNFKDNAKNLNGWNFYSENKGVKIYMKDIEGRTNPATRGEYTILGSYTTYDLFAAAKNSSLRKSWDDRYEDGLDIEILNKDDVLTRTMLKGTFPISARDLAIAGTVESDPETGRIIYVTTSVVDPAVPEVKKYVRANLIYSGWQIDPKFDVNGNIEALDIIYIVDIDIKLDSVPSAILKSISTGTPMVLHNIDESLRKIGFPPYVLESTSLTLSEKINPGNFQYDLSLIAENDGIAVIRLSKTMYPNGFDVSVTPNNTKVELLPDTSINIRITLPSEVTTDELQIKITKYTSNGFKMTYDGVKEIPLALKEIGPKVPEKDKPEPTFITTNDSSVKSTQSLSRSVEIPKETEAVEKSQSQQHTRKLSQSILVNNINSPDSADGTDKDDRAPRKQKRLSFASSPNIINSEPFKPEEEQKTIESEVTSKVTPEVTPEVTREVTREVTPKVTPEVTPKVTPKVTSEVAPSDDEYNRIEAAIREIEEIDAMREIDSEISIENENQIEYPVNKFDIYKDIITFSDNVKFNSYQTALMFLAMVLAFYAGKLSNFIGH